MKRIFGTLVLISFLGILVAPLSASAVTEPATGCSIKKSAGTRLDDTNLKCPTTGKCEFSDSTQDCAMCCIVQTIYNVTDIFFVVLVALSGIMILIGAFNLLFAAGESEKINKGRNYIIYAAVGLAVGFLARAIPALVVFIGGF
ncbi:MAG: hypothetical protein Q8P08_00505 [bacterium]|nr:hypothetical protein [bacterium]